MKCEHLNCDTEIIWEDGKVIGARLICIPCGAVIELGRKECHRVGVNQFVTELHGLSDRHVLENDLSFAEVVGSLMFVMLDQYTECTLAGDTDDLTEMFE